MVLHIISGAAEFASEPICNHLNGVNITELCSAAWYSNENTVFTGNALFNQSIVSENIELLVDDKNLHSTFPL